MTPWKQKGFSIVHFEQNTDWQDLVKKALNDVPNLEIIPTSEPEQCKQLIRDGARHLITEIGGFEMNAFSVMLLGEWVVGQLRKEFTDLRFVVLSSQLTVDRIYRFVDLGASDILLKGGMPSNGTIDIVSGEFKLSQNTKLYIGQETEWTEVEKTTFWRKNQNELNLAAKKISDHYKSNETFGGIAIHTLQGYKKLIN